MEEEREPRPMIQRLARAGLLPFSPQVAGSEVSEATAEVERALLTHLVEQRAYAALSVHRHPPSHCACLLLGAVSSCVFVEQMSLGRRPTWAAGTRS